MVVIAVQPGLEQAVPLVVGGKGLGVGPLFQQGAVEALHLAIDLRAVRRDEDPSGADLGEGLLVVTPVAIGPGVVGHHRREADAAGREPGQGAPDKLADGERGLVAEQFTESQPRMIVDQRVDVVIAQAGPLLQVPSRSTPPPMDKVPAAVGNARQLLDVHVPQLAGLAHFIAPDRATRGPIQPVEPMQLVAAEDPIAGRARQPTESGESMRTQPAAAQLQHRRLPGSVQSAWRAPRPAGSISQTGQPFDAISLPPLVHGRPRDPGRFGHRRCRPPLLQAIDQQLPAKEVKARSRMHKSPPVVLA